MSLKKTVTRENAHAVYVSPDGTWKWYVLKTWSLPKNEKKNEFSRWFCLVTSPIVGETGEFGDTYVNDVTGRGNRLESCTDEWAEAYGIDKPVEKDFELIGQGGDTVFLLKPITDAAKEWADENLPADAQKLGDSTVVEHRYIVDIVCGIRDAGLGVA